MQNYHNNSKYREVDIIKLGLSNLNFNFKLLLLQYK